MQPDDLADLLGEINDLLAHGTLWTASDSDSILARVQLLTKVALYLNERLLQQYGGHSGSGRGDELVEQVVAAPFQAFAGQEAHPDPFDRAAMLWRGITQGHPFGDGNKRTGLALASYYLDAIGFEPRIEARNLEAVYGFCIAISSGEIRDVDVIADRLRQLWRARSPR